VFGIGFISLFSSDSLHYTHTHIYIRRLGSWI